MASRLSYFIWASMPDEELFTRAKDGALTKSDEITKQVQRLLSDKKASAFSAAMSEQWMHSMALEFAKPDKTKFAKWEEPMREALAGEVNAFLAPVLSGQVSAQELLTAKYVYANRMLGTFYGLPERGQFAPRQLRKGRDHRQPARRRASSGQLPGAYVALQHSITNHPRQVHPRPAALPASAAAATVRALVRASR